MILGRTIGEAGITDSWEQVRTCLKFVDKSNDFQVSHTCFITHVVHLFEVFQYPELLDKQTLEELQIEWARYFLELRSSL